MTEQRDNKANGITGNNQGTIVVGRDGFPYSQHRCLLSAAGKSMPLDAQYVSMRMKGKDISVRSANDVLVWVCKKMSVYQPKQLQSMMKSRKVSWIKVNRIGMNRPYRVTFNCYVDLDGVGPTSLFRAATILKWLSWPKNDVTISYKSPQKSIIDVETVPPVAPVNSDVELKDVPSERLVRTILLEMLKQGKDDGETWAEFMSAPRCRRELGLSNSLLHKMKPWETIEEYADEYSVLDGDADYMILSDLGWLDRDEFLRWVQNIGMSLEEICSLLHAKLPSRPVPTPPTPPIPEPPKLERLKNLILKNYPRGIVLNNATTALLEKESGKPLDEVDLNRVRLEMFARADGTLLYPEMVMGMDGLERMKNRAKELLAKYRMFAYGCLWNEFAGEMRNLLDERDFARFFDRFFARDVGMVYASRDRLGKMMCLGEIHDFPETVGEKVRSVLAECGDAVSIDNLLVQLPYLSREVIDLVGQEVLHDVVVFDVEGERYLKLLESYFLPDDFSRVVSDFVAITEASQGVVSIVLLESEFESRYGEGFRVNYALEDESVFKQVVLMSFRGRVHDWNRDMFLPYGKRGNSNVAEMFLQSHQDLFHEEEFFKYALESRGLHNTGMLILTFLRKHCIRMSKEWWISLDGFDQKFELSDEQYDAIGHILNDAVGNGRFKSIIELGEDVYEQLPVLQSGEKTYPWNPYVLTSIAVQKVRNACVVNDEPSPYTVTAMILPANSGEIGDVVDYVLRTFPKGFFVDAEAAFDYLRVNHIRLTKTKKLIAKIKALLEMP